MTEIREDEYLDPVDGLIHCRKCGGPRQAVIPDPFKGGSFKPRCVCPCQQETERRRKEAEERRQRMATMIRLILSLMRSQNGAATLGGNRGHHSLTFADCKSADDTDSDRKSTDALPLTPSTRKLFSYVPQGNTMFSGTIAENMRNVSCGSLASHKNQVENFSVISSQVKDASTS